MKKYLLLASITCFSSQINAETQTPITQEITSPIKAELITKLTGIAYFSAQFSQQVFDNEQQLLSQASGELVVSKPNKLKWQTKEPDESLILADGQDVYLYDPFIEEVKIYGLAESIADTPLLLLTSEDKSLWREYTVEKLSDVSYQISSFNPQAQVKHLVLTFDGIEINQLKVIDATNQQSVIDLTERNYHSVPNSSVFNFIVPEGVDIDDQR